MSYSSSSSTPTPPQTPLDSPVLSQSDFSTSPILSPLSPRVQTLSPAKKSKDSSSVQSKPYNPNIPPFEYKLDKQVPQIHSQVLYCIVLLNFFHFSNSTLFFFFFFFLTIYLVAFITHLFILFYFKGCSRYRGCFG